MSSGKGKIGITYLTFHALSLMTKFCNEGGTTSIYIQSHPNSLLHRKTPKILRLYSMDCRTPAQFKNCASTTFICLEYMAGAVAGGGALLSASLQVLFDRMASRDVLTVLQGQKLSATLLRELKMKLLAVKVVLNDAEAKQITNSDVKDWVDELKDAVYDAEDLLDDITTEALRCKMESDSQTQITGTLENLAKEKDFLGLKEGVGENWSKRWPTTSLVDKSGVYGRDGDREEIVKYLLSHNASGNKISVIALVGMGGIGKTTLAKLVYNDWRAIDSGTSDHNDLNLLQHKLEERLTRKKFLLVLDDVWNEDYNDWDSLQTPFNVGLYGSKIVVTTRINKVAAVMHSVHTHHLAKLSSEDCWSLFAKHAFENGNSSPHPKLEEIGKEIVKKCDGLPLAAKTLGGALYSEVRVKEWENVLNSEMWDLPNNAVLPALILSYYYLPSHLKRCFAYCSIFPKDYQIEKDNLILLWMAEGFLQQSEKGKKTMEEVGDGYFYDLLSRSFFQKSGSHKSYFVMHDLINDLAQLISGKVCVQLNDGEMNEIPKKLRYLSYFRSEYDSFERFETLSEVNGLRTFLPLNLELHLSTRVWNDLLMKVQYLRVLSLCYYEITDLSDSIGNLKHLRYLDLTYTPIKRLPQPICNLYNLQTLILYHCEWLVELPKMMCKLISLRHLDIRHSRVKKMPSQMGQLKSLQKLSNYVVGKQSGTRVGELRELSHIGGSLVIQELQNLEWGRDRGDELDRHSAQLLTTSFKLKETHYSYVWWFKISRLGIERVGADQGGEFPRLKELYIERCPKLIGALPNHLPLLTKLEIVQCEQLVAQLPRIPAIRVLTTRSCDISQWKELPPLLQDLEIQNSDSLESLLEEGMLRSNTCLRELTIRNCSFSRPLGRVCLPITLKSLYIELSKKLEFLLPDLTSLTITNCNKLTSQVELGLQGLHSLTSLKISDLPNLRSLDSLELQLLTSLQKLQICNCPKLQSLTEEQLPTNLYVLTIQNCPLLKDRCKFWTGEDWHHIAHIPHIVIDDQVEWDLQGLASLPSLKISGLPNLRSLNSLGLQLLTSFQKLEIHDCPKLQSLKEELLPTSLSVLTIQNCPLLKGQCKFWTGEDWHHIAHIPYVVTNDQVHLDTSNSKSSASGRPPLPSLCSFPSHLITQCYSTKFYILEHDLSFSSLLKR
ncbi:unnamed protein product, partial [Vitis vinifera]